jgi:hypothetical protein
VQSIRARICDVSKHRYIVAREENFDIDLRVIANAQV